MKHIKHITKTFIAHLLVLAIVFPSVLQFTHIFENHEHTFCGDVTTHLHEQDLDCDLTKFISNVFSWDIKLFDFKEVSVIKEKPSHTYISLHYKKLPQSLKTRGPPLG